MRNCKKKWLQAIHRIAHGVSSTLVCFALLLTAGCSRYLPEIDKFGAVTSPDVNRSHNGLGLHIRLWQAAGAKCIMPQKLTPRLDDVDVIILVGKSYAPPGRSAREWLEDWLNKRTGRAVIYFGRDLNAETYYRTVMLDKSRSGNVESKIAEQLAELASIKATDLAERVEQVPESTFCRWFYLDAGAQPNLITKFSGPWSNGLNDLRGNWPTGIQLVPPDRSQESSLPSWLATAPGTPRPITGTPITGTLGNRTVDRSIWRYDELSTKDLWAEEFEDIARSPKVLLSSADGLPLVFELEIGDRGNNVMIVNNGAPFLNATLVQPLHRQVAEEIIERYAFADEVAFIAYDESGILLSTAKEPDSRAAGLEMFLTWPIGAITLPLMLTGILICIALLPILGRAKKLPERDLADFGMHIDSIGSLLAETGDATFARDTIRAYYRRVRGEAPPPWLNETPTPMVPTEQSPTRVVNVGDGLAKTAAHKNVPKTTPSNPTNTQ